MRTTLIEKTSEGWIVKLLQDETVVKMSLIRDYDDAVKFSEQYIKEQPLNEKVLLKENL
jgi:hypothetical protein